MDLLKKRNFIKVIALGMLFTFFSLNVRGQEEVKYAKNSLKFGVGLGFLQFNSDIGLGPALSAGYQRSFLDDNFRANANFTLGKFVPFFVADAPSLSLTGFAVQGDLNLVNSGSFSLFFGTGAYANFVVEGSGAPVENQLSLVPKEPDIFSYGGLGAIGIRLESKSSRTVLEIVPVNIQFGHEFFFWFMKIGLDVRLGSLASEK